MSCPNCDSKLSKINLDGQAILHCNNCAGNFFEQNGINRISMSSVDSLTKDRKSFEISGSQKFCPKDHSVLFPVSEEENIPQNIILLRCPKCSGIFVYPDDLPHFKLAQNAKTEYFRLWNKPIPSVRSIVVLSFLFAISVSLYLSYNYIGKKPPLIQAENIVQNFSAFETGRYLIASFRTVSEYSSEIEFFDRIDGSTLKRDVSKEPKTFHFVTISGLNLQNDIEYRITLTDRLGRKDSTEIKKLELR